MQLNETEALAIQISRMIRNSFGDKMEDSGIYDVVDDPNNRKFKINFQAYDYFCIQFSYELGLISFSIVLNDQFGVSLSKKKYAYSEIQDWDSYLREIMKEIELRIPDKFLKVKGWL